MSLRYKGGVISATPPTTSTSSASGSWTLQQQLQAIAAGLWPVNGPFYIEDVFSTYLYTGNGSTQTITNGIDLSTKGGLVWTKDRTVARGHVLIDTVRGGSEILASNTTGASSNFGSPYLSFASTGYNIVTSDASVNGADNYVSWTFRKQPKFFDVVTWTGDGQNYRAISHSLGSTPGMVIVKSTSASGSWAVWHRSVDPNNLILNSTSAAISGQYSIQDVGSTSFAVANSTFYGFPQSIPVNNNGATYVAYLFAHNAGGFGLTGSDNVISCGSFTTDGSGLATVSLGYEPQWILAKKSSGTADSWLMVDNMRGFVSGPAVNTSDDARLVPNLSNAEAINDFGRPTATGFEFNVGVTNADYIYIAIRRGPMKTPTSGTSVFSPLLATSNLPVYNTGFPVDASLNLYRVGGSGYPQLISRLLGAIRIATSSSAAEVSDANITFDFQNGWWKEPSLNSNWSSCSFRRAPGFFDVVCATTDGNGVYTGAHNLGVAPELIITKTRNAVDSWLVYSAALGVNYYIVLNSNAAAVSSTGVWGSAPTASTFTIFNNIGVATQVSYLFATVAGVSKVGSYTGTGTTLQVNCGFTGGARFVLIKKTSGTGSWYVWDSSRGIVAGNDPYLLLNSTAAEVTNTDYVDTYSAGFEISSTAPSEINENGGSFIFLAIA